MDSKRLEKSLKKFNEKSVDYLNNIIIQSFPLGIHIEIFDFKSISKSFIHAKKSISKTRHSIHLHEYK